MRRILIIASAPHSALIPIACKSNTVMMHHVNRGHEPIQGPIWPSVMESNRLGLPDPSVKTPREK
ncbi:hypothetical protein V8C42DRAFT_314780 [Trichoderma barbatum]